MALRFPLLVLGSIACGFSLFAPGLTASAHAANFVVTTLSDSVNGSCTASVCSLDDAMVAANANGSGETDNITFAASLSGTMKLNGRLPPVDTSENVIGPTNRSIVIDGRGIYQAILVDSPGVLHVQNLTFQNCYNTSSYGGAIYNQGTTYLGNCTFTKNKGQYGGAVASYTDLSAHSLTVSQCTFNGNTSPSQGGALLNEHGQMYVFNCTITGNTAPGNTGSGIASFGDSGTLTQVTESIVAGNVNSDVDYLGGGVNSFISSGYNLVGRGNATDKFKAAGDFYIGIGTPALNPLAFNGGPTPTMSLLPTSPALNNGDAGFNGSGKTDQRGPGYPRVEQGRLDIGALEMGNVGPTDIGVTPNTGSGANGTAQTFTTVYSDPNGAADITDARLLISNPFGAAHAIGTKYLGGLLYLLSDDGTTFLGGFAPGSAHTIANSQGSLNCAATTVSKSGLNLNISWNITPALNYTGLKTLALHATDSAGNSDGWDQQGDFSFTAGTNAAPVNGTVSPATGTSLYQTPYVITATYSDPNGAADITDARILINTGLTGAGSLTARYTGGKLYLVDNNGKNYLGGYAPGSPVVTNNSQGALNIGATKVTLNGNTLTIAWSFTPFASFGGQKQIYLLSNDESGAQDGWDNVGQWTVQVPPSNTSVSPASGSSAVGAARSLTSVYTDPSGAADITDARLLINSTLSGANSLTGRYVGGKLYLASNDGKTYLGGFVPGSSNVISNVQGSLNCAATTVTLSGNTLTIKWSFTPSATFTGTKALYALVSDKMGSQDGWDDLGTWNITGNAIQAGIANPSGGSS